MIKFDLDMIKKIKIVIGIAFGPRKAQAIKAAIRGKIINVLITDKNTAEKII
jgi:deoxyribonucleoside regulator